MDPELKATKLNAETHLLLEKPLLTLPYELCRRDFKVAQKEFERDREFVLSSLKSAANASLASQDPSKALDSLDNMINRMQGLKRKMEALHEEEKVLHQQSKKRIQHLQDLYEIPSLTDVKYDDWSKVRLNRLLVDYLLRSGYIESARALAEEKGIEDLVDLDCFTECHKIAESLRKGNTKEGLAWCAELKPLMRKTGNNLEFELRLQQYIELLRTRRIIEARQHAQKYIIPQVDTYPAEINRACGLLAYPPDTFAEPYRDMYSATRWHSLAALFIKTHHDLFSLPPNPLLHIALSAGLSALKTPACHSLIASSSSNARSSTTSVCPICSTELNELARNLPYAHHTKSYVENDPVVLPNRRIYGRERLMREVARRGLEEGQIRDPTTGEIFGEDEIRKVYIT